MRTSKDCLSLNIPQAAGSTPAVRATRKIKGGTYGLHQGFMDVLVMRNSEPAQRKALRLALDEMSKGLKEVEGEERADG